LKCGEDAVETEMNGKEIPFPTCLACNTWQKDIPEGCMAVVSKLEEYEE
jgi:hypothetical protein